MVNYLDIVPFILKWEGGKAKHPEHGGGFTNKGITYETFNNLALKVLKVAPSWQIFDNLTDQQAGLFVKYFFDMATGGNKVKTPAIAYMLTEWFFNSGRGGLISFQRMLNQKFGAKLTEDSVIGPKSLAVINSVNQKQLYDTAIAWRANFYKTIAKQPDKAKFLKGWLNRLNDFATKYPAPIIGATAGILFGLGLLFFLINNK